VFATLIFKFFFGQSRSWKSWSWRFVSNSSLQFLIIESANFISTKWAFFYETDTYTYKKCKTNIYILVKYAIYSMHFCKL